MSATVWFVTHPAVVIDPAVPVTEWPLTQAGRDRVTAALSLPWTQNLAAIWSSTERKAIDAAEILAAARGMEFSTLHTLGENDRSSTGYLPREEFEATANLFFANPQQSIYGWERAVDAQRRIVAAVETVLATSPAGNVAIVAHGAVGALLMAALENVPISRIHDQPAGSGGNLFAFDRFTRLLRHGWQPIDSQAYRDS